MPNEPPSTPIDVPSTPDQEQLLLETVRELLRISRPGEGNGPRVALGSRLDRDLGLDSLARAELVSRVERRFRTRLPERALTAETPGELLDLLLGSPGEQPGGRDPGTVSVSGGVEGGVSEPVHSLTLVEVLAWHVEHTPDRVHIRLYEDEDRPQPLSYRELWQDAARLAAGLIEQGVSPGDRIALMLPTGTGYFFSFFGVLLAGAVPVPIYPPTRPSQVEEHLRRHARILQSAGARLLITVEAARGVARLLQVHVPAIEGVVTPEQLSAGQRPAAPVQRLGGDTAFLQYTSGSTGDPKGVTLSHADLLANIRAMGQAAGVGPEDVFVSWLPLYHDMGLIGAWLGSLYFGIPLVVMSPLRFLSRPAQWLWALHRHRGTLSAAPNFAYELCLNKVTAEEIEGLDLSAWRWAFNGAEPVSADTLERFAGRFAAYGLRAGALAPVYGLAEAAVGLAFPPPGRGPLVDCVRRERLLQGGRAVPVPESHADALRLVACGRPLPGYRVRVIDSGGNALADRREGRLQFQGPSATRGYFNNPEATRRLYQGEWLDTGDRAYLVDGEIYITGRSKEVIIRGGRNLYPYEVEQAVGEMPGIRKGCVAMFAATDSASGTERVVVLAETRESSAAGREALARLVRDRCTDLLGSPPDEVVIAPPHTVLKTSSGKIRRAALRNLHERGLTLRGPRAVGWQLLRAGAAAVGARLGHWRRRMGEGLYAALGWTLFGVLVPVVWLGVVLLPLRPWRWNLIRLAILGLRWGAGVPLAVEGAEELPPDRPCVLVANHASYLDALALIAAVPRDCVYVAKQELEQAFFSRVFLRRLGTLFVERFDIQRSAGALDAFSPRIRAGESLVFFPEGTFRAEPGLLPFRSGAFAAAVEAGVPVVPVTIQGTRSILRAGSWFPHRGAIRVTLHPPLRPEGGDWSAVMALRDRARSAILARSGETDLAASG